MSVVHAIVLGLVQGLTEFLPVSSSGHLILVPQLLGWPDQGIAFDAMVHFGTALAAIYHYRSDCHRLLQSLFMRDADAETKHLRNAIIVGSVPAVVAALLFHKALEAHARNVVLVAVNLIVWALIMLAADTYAKRKQQGVTAAPKPVQALAIGAAQAMALLPGTSRSGASIAAAIFTGQTRSSAVRFSFLLGLPIILLASLSAAVDLVSTASRDGLSMAPLWWGLISSFLGGVVAIRFLIRFVEQRALTWFAVYRIALAVVILFALR